MIIEVMKILTQFLVKLESSKVKDRNDGLSGLESYISSNSNLNNKDLTNLCQSLFGFLEAEKNTYRKNQTTAVESRLQTSSYLLRKVIVQNVQQMKFKLVKETLNNSREALFTHDDEIIRPLALNISKIIHAIIATDEHREHISSNDWIKLLENILRILNKQLSKSMTDKFVSELLGALKIMVVHPQMVIEDLGYDLTEFLVKYFNLMKKENSLTSSILEITNHLIIQMSTSKIRYSVKLVRTVVKVAGSMISTNYESLKDQLLVFGLVSSDFILENLPKMIDVEDSQGDMTDDDGIRDDLTYWLDQWIQLIIRSPSDSLSLSDIDFTNESQVKNTWFKFDGIRLTQNGNFKSWLVVLSLTNLISVLYHLHKPQRLMIEAPNKKRKLDVQSFSNVIERSSGPLELLNHFIHSGDVRLQYLGFQVMIFYIHNHELDFRYFKIDEIIAFHDKPEVSGYASLLVGTLLKYGWKLTTNQLSQLLRINLQMLKDRSLVNISSQTIIYILSTPGYVPTDSSLKLQIQAMFEFSELNGPVIITNNSLKFWVLFSQLGKEYRSGNKFAGDRIIDWLISKWDYELVSSAANFPEFVSWLAGLEFSCQDTEIIYENQFYNFNLRWLSRSDLAGYILCLDKPVLNIGVKPNFNICKVEADHEGLSQIVDKLLYTMELYDSQGDITRLFKLVKDSYFIFQVIQRNMHLESSTERLKYDIRRYIENLDSENFAYISEALFQLRECKPLNESGEFIFSCFDIQELVSDFKKANENSKLNRSSADVPMVMNEFDDFGDIRKESDEFESQVSKTYFDVVSYKTNEQRLLEFIISVYSRFSNTKNVNTTIDQAIRYLEDVDPEVFSSAFFTLLEYLDKVETTKIQALSISRLLRLLGNKLLSSYKYERSPITIVLASRLFIAFTKPWLQRINEDWASDYSDMFQWIVALAEKGLITEEMSSYYFTKSIFVKLSHESDLSTQEAGINMFQRSTNLNKIRLCSDLKSFLVTLPFNDQIRCFEDLNKGFVNPQTLDDLAATFSFCLRELFTISYAIFIHGLSKLLLNYGYLHFKPYVEAAILPVADSINSNKLVIFEIMKVWLDNDKEIDTFPYRLLGFDTFGEFIEKRANVIYALLISSRKTNTNIIVNNKVLGGEIDESELLLDTLSYSIPLSFIKGGRKGEIFSLIGQIYDSSLIDHQRILLVRNFLDLCDYSRISDFMKYAPEIKDHELLKLLFVGSPPDLFSLVNIKIPMSAVIHEINQITDQASTKFWSIATVGFLIKGTLEVLPTISDSKEKLLVLRKLRLIFILGFDNLKNEHILFLVLDHVSSLLVDDITHDDASEIIVFLLTIIDEVEHQNDRYCELVLKIVLQLSKYKQEFGRMSYPVECKIMDIYSTSKFEGVWKSLFIPMIHLLTTNITALEETLLLETDPASRQTLSRSNYVSIHGILRFAAKHLNSSSQDLVLQSLDLLFSQVPHLNEFFYKLKTDSAVSKLLKESQLLFSVTFDHFRARYLGRHYTLTGDELNSSNNELSKSFEDHLEQKTSNLESLTDALIRRRTDISNVKELVLIDDYLGMGLYEYNRGNLEASSIMKFDSHLKDLVKLLVPLDWFIFSSIHSDPITVYPWSELASVSSLSDKATSIWCRDIILSVLSYLNENSFLYKSFSTYLFQFPSISESIFCDVLLFYLRQGRSTEEKLLIKLINNTMNFSENSKLVKEKARLVLKLIYFMNIGKEDIKQFRNVLGHLDSQVIYQLASSMNMPKFALLTFEAFYSDPTNKSHFSWVDDSKSLESIYNQLNDKDLFHGLPIQPSLTYAMASMNRESKNNWRNVVFSSANLDSSITLRDYTNFDLYSSKEMVLNSLVKNSLLGVSDMLNDQLDPQERLKRSYEWSWKLGQWNLPASESPKSEDEFIYCCLKGVHESKNYEKSFFEESVRKLLKSQDNKEVNVTKTLASLYNIELIQSLDNSDLIESSEEFSTIKDGWFKQASFADIENLLLSRRISYGEGKVNCSSTDNVLFQALEIQRYTSLSRSNNEIQRSTNSSMLLDKIVRSETNLNINKYLSKVSSFETACTLWDQGETAISIEMLKDNLKNDISKPNNVLINGLDVFGSVLNAYLVKWTSESRQEKFENIMQTYVNDALRGIEDVTSVKDKSKVYHILGYFCYKQTTLPGAEEEVQRQEKLLKEKHAELQELKIIIQNKSTPADEKKNAKRYFQRMQLQYESDKDSYNTLFNNRIVCIEKALEFFLNAIYIDDSYDDEDIDKICALWLEYFDADNINNIFSKWINKLPCHKFISWLNQLVSRLADEKTSFQTNLQNLLINICFKHPYHSLYFIMNLRVHKLYQISRTDSTIHSRSAAADNLWKTLSSKNSSFHKDILDPVQSVSSNALTLATEKVPNSGVKQMKLDNLKVGDFWINQLRDLNIPLPTANQLSINPSGEYENVPKIVNISPILQISSSGISLPKIMRLQLSDGSKHKMLLKGSTDDLRQDAIMEQVFEKVNTILKNDKETRKRSLKMRTYKVVPLGPQAGMIEFVANSIALSDILRPLHSKDSISFSEAREMMRNCQSSGTRERLNVYLKICKETQPIFRQFFIDTFTNIDEWYESRQIYTKGISTNSIVGYMLGLGDRHLNNILIDKETGEPIHIDLGVAFDQGKLLPVPELVPFRLTRDIVDGLGITGVEGSFKKSSEHVFRVLRENVEKIIGILNVLKYDPLYSWAISPIRKKRLQEIENHSSVSSKFNVEGDGSDAARAVKGVETKLNANGLSVEASVEELIQEATDYKNLGVIYLGWTPFY
ncbi:hypothetical protein BN7_6584 [Wickerhamomyces ciferrii]|uniref:Serine/threonine-protein kinase TEL1 n=1 Tax=Wickerhamomyces ciferrii (strain ATCC 14091 / BCRC 22168 / CBS 111 / JCM 3599 / NBRC 0793 / NRRL Y-1031 F-60-10) TaxID=1206466 RepID=K0KY24_WICCF|nr:uncharacterized protein BN7_6584 [Wickerhamomyces ciferrii]CCH46977.1 hypothetical protein BN7_6584 [Wickerhamomyces ciferrii]